MNKKYEKLIMNIARIKINIGFTIIFMGGVLYCADRLAEANGLREIFFWVSIMLIIMFKSFTHFSEIINMVEEWYINSKFANGRKNDE